MDALKKFLQKKKTDKSFKGAGPGQTLSAGSGGNSPAKSSGHGQHRQQQQKTPPRKEQHSQGPSEEKKAAAAAALARIEKSRKPGEVDSEKLRASRQMAFIKEQARRELEADKLKEQQASASTSPPKAEEHFVERESRSKNPEAMAVNGVYFSCALIGPAVLTKPEIEENIKEFLLDQPEEELGVTACLLIHSCNKPYEKVSNCVETLCKYLDNIISNPEEQKFRRIRCSNRVFQEKVANAMGAEQFLRAAGFQKAMLKADDSAIHPEEFWVFHPEDEANFVAHLTELRDMLQQTTPIKPELDRNLQVLMPAQVNARRDVPDDFYALSLEEVKKEQQLRAEIAEKELTLRTKAMRDRDELREQRLYKYGIMRVRFPDGFTLQGTFKAHEKLENLYNFVRENLVTQDIHFELVQPGREPLTNYDATLASLKLPPSSILNFKVDSAPAPLATGEISFLKPEILALVKSV